MSPNPQRKKEQLLAIENPSLDIVLNQISMWPCATETYMCDNIESSCRALSIRPSFCHDLLSQLDSQKLLTDRKKAKALLS